MSQPASPNFLFSTWPKVEWNENQWRISVTPDDQPRMHRAANRLMALGGGILRMSAGDFQHEPFYVNDTLFLKGQ